jgi:hypothetical protein
MLSTSRFFSSSNAGFCRRISVRSRWLRPSTLMGWLPAMTFDNSPSIS